MTSSNRMRYPIREIQQKPLVLSVVYGLHNNYQFSGMSSTFCVSLFGLEIPFNDQDLRYYNAAQKGVLLQPRID